MTKTLVWANNYGYDLEGIQINEAARVWVPMLVSVVSRETLPWWVDGVVCFYAIHVQIDAIDQNASRIQI